MKSMEIASLICQDLNTSEEEWMSAEPITSGVEAVPFLEQQWLKPNIELKKATEESLHLAIKHEDVVITKRNVFGDWRIEY